jgi:hypothetical protein
MKSPLVNHDFAPDPFWISLYMRILTVKNIICYDLVRDLNFKHLDIMEYFVMQQSKCK